MSFKTGDIVISPDGLGRVLSRYPMAVGRLFDKMIWLHCLELIPPQRGYTPSFEEKSLKAAIDANEILKEIL